MVARINTGHSLHRSLNYNEYKVREGVARCIGQGNYPLNADRMNFALKLGRLVRRAELNPNVKRNSVHISLNFDPSEQLSDQTMKAIADSYMKQIGFGKQPYLVYRHEDAGHPHLHICSVNIRSDGIRIDMNNIGKNQSEQARKAIEKTFGLVEAEKQTKQDYTLQPVDARKVQYGKTATKKTIQTVLNHVLDRYRYSSLPQLNAILEQYNVQATRGQESSRMYRLGGLHFRILSPEGTPVGVPVKASLFYQKPILKNLEARFEKNKTQKTRYRLRLKHTIDKVLHRQPITSLEALALALKKKGIHMVSRHNEAGRCYGLTYVDHNTRTVFNGSELGKAYSPKVLTRRFGEGEVSKPKLLSHSASKPGMGLPPQPTAAETKDTGHNQDFSQDTKPTKAQQLPETMTDILLQPEQVPDYLPYHLKKYRKRKKKKKG